MSLIELLVGLATSGIATAIAVTALASAARVAHRHRLSVSIDDAAWQALAVIARDLRSAKQWGVCTEARDCPLTMFHRPYRQYLLHTEAADWLLAGELKRCIGTTCFPFIDGVARFDIAADIEQANGKVRRTPLLQWHAGQPRLVEVSLTMSDGRMFSRVVATVPRVEQAKP